MDLDVLGMIKLLLPVIIINYALDAFAIYKLFTAGERNLSKLIWLLIILFIQIFGSVAFLVAGVKHD